LRTDQLKRHPLYGQIDHDSLKLPEKTANDLEELEDFQKQIDTFDSLKGFIQERLANWRLI